MILISFVFGSIVYNGFCFQFFVAIALVGAVSADVHAPAHGYGYAPEFYCRDTNTSVYAEVCVPAFADKVTPVELAVKVVEDEDYCFDRVLTICEETEVVVDREICTYEYEGVTVTPPCTTTQVTYEQKSETMKVTACGAAGYGYGHQSYGGEHQVCKEEYQTQAYKVPLVNAPLELTCSLSYPAPKQVCVTKAITITEVKCEDKIEQRCFNVAKFADSTNTIEQVETVIREPKCQKYELTLDTQECSPLYHG